MDGTETQLVVLNYEGTVVLVLIQVADPQPRRILISTYDGSGWPYSHPGQFTPR